MNDIKIKAKTLEELGKITIGVVGVAETIADKYPGYDITMTVSHRDLLISLVIEKNTELENE